MDGTRLDGIAKALAALAAAGGDRAPESLTPGDLVAVGQAFGALIRQVDAAFAPFAAEIARQSRVELGKDSLAKKQGFRTPVALIQATTGSSVGEAIKIVQVGEATASRTSLVGEALPSRHPHVAAALASGALGMTAASAIIGLIDRLALRVDATRLDAAERELSERAPGLRADEFARLLTRAEALLDPDGVEPRHEECRAKRSLTIHERDGMLHLTGVFDVETGAPIKNTLEAMVTRTLQRNEHADDATRDDRSVAQMRADALADLCTHGAACDQLPTGVGATVIVRMTLEELETGIGTATIDGCDTPLPAGAVRRLAADLSVIPCVLGGGSEILDWGREKRRFTRAQKLALVERDGGCVMCGAPPPWTHVHHTKWWARDGGTTDLEDGLLVCTGCHHRIHDDGWDIEIDGAGMDATIWFLPPPWLDPQRTPRLGGAARYRLVGVGG